MLPQILSGAGFEVTRVTEMVQAGASSDAREWIDLMRRRSSSFHNDPRARASLPEPSSKRSRISDGQLGRTPTTLSLHHST